MSEGNKTVILICWETLDGVMEELMPLIRQDKDGIIALGDEERLCKLKSKARGMAEIIAIWTTPHFRTADDVAKEANRRHKAREAGEEHTTPGTMVGNASVDLAVTFSNQGLKSNPTKAAPEKARPVLAVSSEVRAQLINGFSSGFFTVSDLAKMYSISEQSVKSIVGA